MTKLLIGAVKRRNKQNYRSALGVMSGIVGIICNILLCIVKFIIGSATGAVSITADALNNLADAGSNIITIAGTKLSEKPVDNDHPFGHGRIEYLSALVVSFLIFLMGFELGKSSIQKIIHPEEVEASIVSIVIIVLAVLVKCWMAFFNNRLYKETNNINLKAVSQDSLNDCISTGATIISMIICYATGWYRIDGIIGLFVSLFILWAGVGVVKEALGPLLGQPPEEETVKGIHDIMLSEELIIGVHDLMVHDYGPGRIIASAHAEVPDDVDILAAHEVIDAVEMRISKELNIIICIHMDPVAVNDPETERLKELVDKVIKEYNPAFSFHDFRIVKGEKNTNVIFDVVIPADLSLDKHTIMDDLRKAIKAADSKLSPVMLIEHSYI
ncbi:MAG: cation diffusion facilitator family transporter [Clostridia bacterium]|nr:cation diffusion facilitator family transporter [Clostridia bacterium]